MIIWRQRFSTANCVGNEGGELPPCQCLLEKRKSHILGILYSIMRPSSGCEIYYILILNHQYWVFESRFIRNVVMKPNNFIEYLFAFIDPGTDFPRSLNNSNNHPGTLVWGACRESACRGTGQRPEVPSTWPCLRALPAAHDPSCPALLEITGQSRKWEKIEKEGAIVWLLQFN